MKEKDSESSEHKTTLRESLNILNVSQVGLFVLALIYTLYFVRPVVLPVILALLLTLVLKPMQLRVSRWLHLPSPASALVVILLFFSSAGVGLYYLAYPAVNYAEKLKEEIVQNRLQSVFSPLTELHREIESVAEKVEEITEKTKKGSTKKGDKENGEENGGGEADTGESRPGIKKDSVSVKITSEEDEISVESGEGDVEVEASKPPVRVEIRENRVETFYALLQEVALHVFLTLALVFFFLAFGNAMLRRLSENEVVGMLVEDIATDVSRYLFTITAINACLGILTGLAMFFLGMPNALLWGTLAAVLNFIPYIGAIIGTGIVFVVAAITFSNPATIAAVPIVYYALTFVEGNFVTPAVIGGRFTINPIVVFLWVVAWGALWGIPGMLIGLPLLMVFRIVVTRFPSMARVERVIST